MAAVALAQPLQLRPASVARPRLVITCSSLEALPPRTCTEAAAQARAALRRYREQDRAAPQARPRRLQVWLPVSSPGKPREDDSIYAYDASDWPGGIQQRFRRLRPLVETLLEGYSPSFVGMLESPADGIGVWRAGGGDTTVVTQVGNVNFAPFARLCAGDFGASVLDPGHTILAVNPTWTKSGDIGQLWDRKLRAQAAAIIDEAGAWLPLWWLSDVRTARGATGMLYRCWPGPWALFSTSQHQETPTDAFSEEPVLVSDERPTQAAQLAALNGALAAAAEAERQRKAAARKEWWGR